MNHVLVVEDDSMNALLFRKLIEKRCGYQVTVTESPDLVLELVRGGGVGLVLMDVSLANTRYQGRPLNGVELCRLLKSDPATCGVPVVLVTAHAMRGDDETLLAESGADAYLSKPIIDHAAFVERIQRLAGREAA
jgi:CheY-like chemotaxis protein